MVHAHLHIHYAFLAKINAHYAAQFFLRSSTYSYYFQNYASIIIDLHSPILYIGVESYIYIPDIWNYKREK